MKPVVPIELLREIFDLRDGKLFWKVQRKGMNWPSVGLRAGYKHSQGYWMVSIGGHLYYEHRVVFAMAHDRWPAGHLDHANLDKLDNRPENLREATYSQNGYNRLATCKSKSGSKGVWFDNRRKKWCAALIVDKKSIWLGNHPNFELAKFIHDCAVEKYHGAFART